MSRKLFLCTVFFVLVCLFAFALGCEDNDSSTDSQGSDDDDDTETDDDAVDDDDISDDDDASDDDAGCDDDDIDDDDTTDDDDDMVDDDDIIDDDDTDDDDLVDDDDADDDDDFVGPEAIRAMSFNLRTGLAPDGDDAWSNRKQIVTAYIASELPDVMGVQEALIFQLAFIKTTVPGYEWVGRSRRLLPDEYSAVFYRADKFTLIDQSTFWLSDTPDVVGSMFSTSQLCPRIVTWAKLESNASGRVLFVFNTHFDTYHGDQVHEKSAALLAEKIEEIAQGAPVIVTGDFNESVGASGYNILTGVTEFNSISGNLVDPWIELSIPDEGTFHDFTGIPTGSSRIDWVLHTEQITPTDAVVSHYNQGGQYPSDHFPVYTDFTWPD